MTMTNSRRTSRQRVAGFDWVHSGGEMKTRRRISLVLGALLLSLTIAGAATLRFVSHSSPGSTNKIETTGLDSGEPRKSTATQQSTVTPQAIGSVDPHVIAGGGGTSSGGNITVAGTIGEVSASQPMSGGSI